MSKMKRIAEAKAKKGIFGSGAAGMSSKGEELPKKNKGEEIKCPYCEKIYKQDGRLKDHIKRQHAAEAAAAEAAKADASAQGESEGSRGANGPDGLKKVTEKRVTEKNPKALLHEWCQKNKRITPKYKDIKDKETGKYHCKVILPDKKIANHDVVCMTKNLFEPAESSMEASQNAAVAALHRMAGNLQWNRLLPQQYRPRWNRLEELKKEREEEFAKKRQERKKEPSENRKKRKPANLQSVYMSEENRKLIEEVLRQVRGEREEFGTNEGSASLTATQEEILAELVKLGFARTHASVAVVQKNSVEAALDWLVLNVPEHLLPSKFAPGSSGDPLKVLNKSGSDLGSALDSPEGQYLIERGYERKEANAALKGNSGDQYKALAALFEKLVGDLGDGEAVEAAEAGGLEPDQVLAELAEERVALEAILGEDNVDLLWLGEQREDALIALRVPANDRLASETTLELLIRRDSHYPSRIPVVAIQNGLLPREVLKHATMLLAEHGRDLLGSSMAYDLWSLVPQACIQALEDVVIGEVEVDGTRSNSSAPSSKKAPRTQSKQVGNGITGPPRERSFRIDPKLEAMETKRLFEHESRRINPSGKLAQMEAVRSRLPAAKEKDEIIASVGSRRVVVISGATGCGKSTQVPQYILEQMSKMQVGGQCNILCTQPRRISAVGLAERVAAERAEECGSTVGYSIRLESKQSRSTRLLFCTTGIVLRRLQSDSALEGVSHVIVDEAHERSVESDLLLLLLKGALRENPGLRLILMSATIDSDLFSEYFADVEGYSAPVVSIPGFTYPVMEYYLEDALEMTGTRIGKNSKYAKQRKPAARPSAQPVTEATKMVEQAPSRTQTALKASPSKQSLDSEENSVKESWEDEGDDEVFTSAAQNEGGDEEDEAEDDDITAESVAALEQAQLEAAERQAFREHQRKDAARAARALEEEEDLARLAAYSEDTKRSLGYVDESVINYELAADVIFCILSGKVGYPSTEDGSTPKFGENEGAILVFLPGMPEIRRMARSLEQAMLPCEVRILPLHGSMPSSEQRRVFDRPPKGVRKIVLATNVAETSITIDDCTSVLDFGRHKEMCYDAARGLSILEDSWVSQASANQRRGRAGRVRPGICFRLFSRRQFRLLDQQQQPEMLRVPLERLCLQVKSIIGDLPVGEILAGAITPPSSQAVSSALRNLQQLAALEPPERLTPLGQHLSRMPMDARVGRMLIFGAMLRCLDPILVIAASMGSKPPFYSPPDQREEADAAHKLFAAQSGKSDHLMIVDAFYGWLEAKGQGYSAEREYCDKHFISQQAMQTIAAGREDYADVLADLGFVPSLYTRWLRQGARAGRVDHDGHAHFNVYSKNKRVVKAVMTAGFYPNVVLVKHPETTYIQTAGGAMDKDAKPKDLKMFTKEDGRVFLHPTSGNFNVGRFESPWLIFSEKVKTAKVFIRDSTMVPSYSLLLFGGQLSIDYELKILAVDEWVKFEAPGRIAVLVRELREEVNAMLSQKIGQPSFDISGSKVVDVLCTLLTTDGF